VKELCARNGDYLAKMLAKEACNYMKQLQMQFIEVINCLPDKIESETVQSVIVKLSLVTYENLICTNAMFDEILDFFHNHFLCRFQFTFSDINKGLFLELIWDYKFETTRNSSPNSCVSSQSGTPDTNLSQELPPRFIREYVQHASSVLFGNDIRKEVASDINSTSEPLGTNEALSNGLKSQMGNEQLHRQYEIFQQQLAEFKNQWASVLKSRILCYYSIPSVDMRLVMEQMSAAGDFEKTPPPPSSVSAPISPSTSTTSQKPTTVQTAVNGDIDKSNLSDSDNKTSARHRHKHHTKSDHNLEPYAHCDYCCPHCGRMDIPTSGYMYLREKLRNKLNAKKNEQQSKASATATANEDMRSIDDLVKFIESTNSTTTSHLHHNHSHKHIYIDANIKSPKKSPKKSTETKKNKANVPNNKNNNANSNKDNFLVTSTNTKSKSEKQTNSKKISVFAQTSKNTEATATTNNIPQSLKQNFTSSSSQNNDNSKRTKSKKQSRNIASDKQTEMTKEKMPTNYPRFWESDEKTAENESDPHKTNEEDREIVEFQRRLEAAAQNASTLQKLKINEANFEKIRMFCRHCLRNRLSTDIKQISAQRTQSQQ